jgi:hypothetical protein
MGFQFQKQGSLMTDNRQIGIIIPYFGPWPEWFGYFVKSCLYNPNIEWLIYSDNTTSVSLPDNVHLIRISIFELCSLIENELTIIPQINHPYKFVDFKPAFGLIFKHDLMNYNFWGYSDLDLIYGTIDHFITPDILEKYDIISPGMDFIPGHFALFRNVEKINTLFMDSPHWKSVLTNPKCFCFDEKYFKNGFEISDDNINKFITRKINQHLRKVRFNNYKLVSVIKRTPQPVHKILQQKGIHLQDFNQIIHHHSKTRQIRLFSQQLYGDDIMKLRKKEKRLTIKWQQGVLYDTEKEIMYFHFQLSKYNKSFKIYETGRDEFELTND